MADLPSFPERDLVVHAGGPDAHKVTRPWFQWFRALLMKVNELGPSFNTVTIETNYGLRLIDTGGDHYLAVGVGSDFTADRQLTLTPGDADRTITLTGNPTLADWFDQSVKMAASPTFATVNATASFAQAASSNAQLKTLTTRNSSNGNAAVNTLALGNDASADQAWVSVYGSAHATKPNLVEILNRAAAALALGGNNAASLTLGTTTVTVALTLTPQGLVDISGAAAGQIQFPASQNASAGANVLDDYEEGSWTPAIAFGGGTTGITYTTQVGRHVKIGKVVFVWGDVRLSSNGTSTGAMTITGLPFTSENTSNLFGSFQVMQYASMAGLTSPITGQVAANQTVVSLLDHGATDSAVIDDTNSTDTSILLFSGFYRATA